MLNEFLIILENVVYEKYRYKITGSNKFTLTELSSSATCTEAKFKKKSGSRIVIFKFDQSILDDANRQQSEAFFFLSSGEARSKCDYLIFYVVEQQGEERLCSVVCNLKSKNISNNNDQMLSGEALASFLIATAIRIYNRKKSNTKNFVDLHLRNLQIKFIKILFVDDRSPILKGTTRPNGMQKNLRKFKCNSEICDLDTVCKAAK